MRRAMGLLDSLPGANSHVEVLGSVRRVDLLFHSREVINLGVVIYQNQDAIKPGGRVYLFWNILTNVLEHPVHDLVFFRNN